MLFDGLVLPARAGRAPGNGSSIEEEFAVIKTSMGSVGGGGDLSSVAFVQVSLPHNVSSVLGSRPPTAIGSSLPHTTSSTRAPPAGAPLAPAFGPSPCPPAADSPPAAADSSSPAAADGSPSATAPGPLLIHPADGSRPNPDDCTSSGPAAGGSSAPRTLLAPRLPPLPQVISIPALVGSGLPAKDDGEGPLSRAQRDAREKAVASHR